MDPKSVDFGDERDWAEVRKIEDERSDNSLTWTMKHQKRLDLLRCMGIV